MKFENTKDGLLISSVIFSFLLILSWITSGDIFGGLRFAIGTSPMLVLSAISHQDITASFQRLWIVVYSISLLPLIVGIIYDINEVRK